LEKFINCFSLRDIKDDGELGVVEDEEDDDEEDRLLLIN
jgi:hypothetical protein